MRWNKIVNNFICIPGRYMIFYTDYYTAYMYIKRAVMFNLHEKDIQLWRRYTLPNHIDIRELCEIIIKWFIYSLPSIPSCIIYIKNIDIFNLEQNWIFFSSYSRRIKLSKITVFYIILTMVWNSWVELWSENYISCRRILYS